MENFTKLECNVFNYILHVTYLEYSTDVKDIAMALELPVNVVKGVVGSLVKKGKVQCVKEKREGILFNDIFPIMSDPSWSGAFGCDVTSFEEWMKDGLYFDKQGVENA